MYLIRVAMFAALCVAAGAGAVSAQTLTARGGLDYSTVSFDGPEGGATGEAGFFAGVAAGFRFFGPASLQIEGLVAQKRISFVDGLIVDKLTFVDVPVLVRYGLYKRGGGRTAHVFGGGVVSLLLAASEKAPGESFDIKDAVKNPNAGVVFGGDYEITSKWIVDARYVVGLTGTYNAFAGGSTGKLRTLQISAGYRFR